MTQGEWWKAGFIVSAIYLAIRLAIGSLWWKMPGHVQGTGSRSGRENRAWKYR